MLTGVSTRDLDPAEVYYEVVDRLWPTNGMCLLEFDQRIDPERVRDAWTTATAQLPLVGGRVERSGGNAARIAFSTQTVTPPGTAAPLAIYDDVPTALAIESTTHVDLAAGPLARCALVDDPTGTAVVLAVHHAVLDGRGIVQLALFVARVLAGEDVEDHPLRSATLPLSPFLPPHHDWSSRRLEMLATAREIRAEDAFVSRAEAPPWHDASLAAARDAGWITFGLTAEQSRAVIDWARLGKATVQGALSAAVMRAVKSLTPGLTRLGLTATVDLRARAIAPAEGFIGQAAALIAGSYDLTVDPATAARTVSADIRRRVDRGEGELFFALSGVEKLPVGDATDEIVRRWTSSATPTVCVSNLGVVAGPTPTGLRGMTLGLVPTPNQVVFIAATTFGGRLWFSLAFDRNRLSIDPETLAATVRSELIALPGYSPGP